MAIGFDVLVAMLACNLVHMQEGAKVAGYICGIVMLSHGAEPWAYAYYRLIETMLGIGVGWPGRMTLAGRRFPKRKRRGSESLRPARSTSA